jgi:hypothetical protein
MEMDEMATCLPWRSKFKGGVASKAIRVTRDPPTLITTYTLDNVTTPNPAILYYRARALYD